MQNNPDQQSDAGPEITGEVDVVPPGIYRANPTASEKLISDLVANVSKSDMTVEQQTVLLIQQIESMHRTLRQTLSSPEFLDSIVKRIIASDLLRSDVEDIVFRSLERVSGGKPLSIDPIRVIAPKGFKATILETVPEGQEFFLASLLAEGHPMIADTFECYRPVTVDGDSTNMECRKQILPDVATAIIEALKAAETVPGTYYRIGISKIL